MEESEFEKKYDALKKIQKLRNHITICEKQIQHYESILSDGDFDITDACVKYARLEPYLNAGLKE